MPHIVVNHGIREPAQHLALDEAALLAAERGQIGETARVWEFDRHVAVLGRSSRIADEIDEEYCRRRDIPIFRRCSGGASIIAGPGCLMYSVVISLDRSPELRKIDAAHQHVMSRVLGAVQCQEPAAELQGICDLTWRNRKCSGNSLRIVKRHLLYHGTILYRFDLDLLAACLKHAPRQPDYREGRDHDAFVTNLAIDPRRLERDLLSQFECRGTLQPGELAAEIERLRETRYDQPSWTTRH